MSFRHFKPSSCPVCGNDTRSCRQAPSGLYFCRTFLDGETVSGFVPRGTTKDGLWGMYAREGDTWDGERRQEGTAGERRLSKRREEVSFTETTFYRWILPLKVPLPDSKRRDLSAHLGIPIPAEIANALHIEYLPKNIRNTPCWIWPERDGHGEIIGWGTRQCIDGEKRSYGKRGLIVPFGWLQRDPTGPVQFPEGMTDTLTGTLMGLSVIGRPSDRGGLDHMAELISNYIPLDRECRIIGENDEHVNKKGKLIWPGRDGAKIVAGELTARTYRPVHWSLPDADSKDLREWFQKESAKNCGKGPKRLGQELSASLQSRQQTQPLAHGAAGSDGCSHAEVARVSLNLDGVILTTPEERAFDKKLNEEVTARYQESQRQEQQHWTCPNPAVVFGTHAGAGLGRVQVFSCRKLSCPVCFKRRKERIYIPSLKYHVGGHAGGGMPLFIAECQRDDWSKVAGQLRRKKAEYFAADIGETIFFVCTHPVSNITMCREVWVDEAIPWMQQKIDAMPARSGKAVHTSRHWSLLEEPKKDKCGWTWHGIVQDADTCKQVLDERQIETVRKQDRSRCPRWWAMEFHTRGIDIVHLHKELERGLVLTPEDIAEEAAAVDQLRPAEWDSKNRVERFFQRTSWEFDLADL